MIFSKLLNGYTSYPKGKSLHERQRNAFVVVVECTGIVIDPLTGNYLHLAMMNYFFLLGGSRTH